MENYSKSANFWFADGNVVLAVSASTATRGLCDAHVVTLSPDRVNSDKSILFRVHKGVLARNSVVFREMFDSITTEVPANLESQDLFEGLPLIRMQDSCEEVKALLDALYDPYPSKLKIRPSSFPFPVLPLCNMAHKFQFDSILESIIAQVVTDWPKNLAELDALSFNITVSNTLMMFRDADPAAVLMFAIRFNTVSIIPGALYRLSRARYSRDWTEDNRAPENPPSLATWRGQVACTREEIEDAMGGGVVNIVALDFTANIPCASKNADSAYFKKLMDSLKRDYLVEKDPLKALLSCKSSAFFNLTTNILCPYCNAELGAQIKRKREEIWGLLVKYSKDLHN